MRLVWNTKMCKPRFCGLFVMKVETVLMDAGYPKAHQRFVSKITGSKGKRKFPQIYLTLGSVAKTYREWGELGLVPWRYHRSELFEYEKGALRVTLVNGNGCFGLAFNGGTRYFFGLKLESCLCYPGTPCYKIEKLGESVKVGSSKAGERSV